MHGLLILVLICTSAFAGDSRQAHEVIIDVDGIKNKVHYYVMKPLHFKKGETYPMLVVIPGSHQPEEGGAENNRGKKGVLWWAYQGTEEFFTVSVWYGNNNDAYPHGSKPNATKITDAMIQDALVRFPINRNRVFLQAFSQGGLTVRNLLQHYTKKAPFAFAGILLTDANCRGGNASTACISPETAIFVGVGSEDKQPNEQFDNVSEAERWVSIFRNKCQDLEHHIIEGQKHNPGPEMMALIKEWVPRVLENVDKHEIEKAAKNAPRALQQARRGVLGPALALSEMALGHTADDNENFVIAKKTASAIQPHLDQLKKEYAAWDADSETAACALLTIQKLFKGHSIYTWADSEIRAKLKADRNNSRIFGAGKKLMRAKAAAIVEAVKSSLK